jgi:hypothetical protein
MNTHKALGLLAAVLITAGQALVFAADTSAKVSDDQTTVEVAASATHDAGTELAG